MSVILERTRHLEDTVGATLVVPVIRGIDRVARALASERAGGAAGAAIAAEAKRLDNEPSIELRTTTHEPAAR
ncbi:hypothetical protein [Nocardia sp. NBC_01009]|uniref:hypothetical protein n=1 Tax=Nocardia sp. NBC_01009 TaxID=2975996 RepID=UPI00386C3FBD|nr:hypothetical protein OHA42_24055 [Nocardia sp. NBC_01009]